MTGMPLLTALVRRQYSLADLIGCTIVTIWVVRGASPLAGFVMIFTLLAMTGVMSQLADRGNR